MGGHGPMGGPPGGSGEKAKDFKGTMRKLVRYMKSYAFKIVIVFIFAIISTVLAILSPKILGRATDKIVDGFLAKSVYAQMQKSMPAGTVIPEGTTGEQLMAQIPADQLTAIQDKLSTEQLDYIKQVDFSKEPSIDLSAVGEILLFLGSLYVLSSAFMYIQSFIMTSITQKMTYRMRKDISVKMDKLPLKYFDTKTHGEVLSRVTNDIDTVSMSLGQSLTQIVTMITTIVGILIMMFTISWLMTLVALLILPISVILVSVIIRFSQKHFRNQQKFLGDLNGHVEEMYGGHTIVKAYNGEERSISEFHAINKKLGKSAWMSQFLSGMMHPLMMFVGNLDYVAVAVLGGYLAVKKTVTIGDIQAFIQYVRQFNQPIAQGANIINVLQSTAAAAERVFEFLNEEEEVAETDQPVHLEHVQGKVTFKDVGFGYSDDKPIIHHFDCEVEPGQRVAIVGPTGAGKTTMVKLLMRFYDVNRGEILIDDVPIKNFGRRELRDMFGMVLQDTWLYNGTIRDNIRYGRLDATDEEVYAAAKAAHVDHFVHTLPQGYDLVLNEEASNISQGQKQLLTIARAVLADPPVLILDEATSSVDTRTEILIQKAMENLMKGRTTFIIAHRLSTIRDADIILVMKDGDIVEKGNHEELMKQNGFYASLYNSQFDSVDEAV